MSARRENTLNVAQARLVRWRILKTLYMGRPYPVSESLMLQIICDSAVAISMRELRAELQYLTDPQKKFVSTRELRSINDNRDLALTSAGTDFVEYHAPADEGIGRPHDATKI